MGTLVQFGGLSIMPFALIVLSGGALCDDALRTRLEASAAKSGALLYVPSGGIGGTASDIRIQAEQMIYTKNKMAELIAHHTGQAVEQIGSPAIALHEELDVVVARGSSQAQQRCGIDLVVALTVVVERVEYTARNGARMRLSLDTATHRVVAVEAAPNPQGDWRDRRRWSDYAQLEGVWWPRQSVREIDGQEVQRTTLRRLTVNGDVDTVLFRRPLVVRGQIRGVE